MKFITTKGAPDIPLKVLEAQENQELVFFCGAGISYPAGLPLFGKLVDNVYEELTEVPNELEQQALKSNLYDRALGLLEARLQGDNPNSPNMVMREIIKQLVIPNGANLDTHKALLDLSITTNNSHRIVTTNVDNAFQLALPDSKEYTDAAPKLPVPKRHKWSSIVHLHGIINKKFDPEGESLVFTSGDFGSAYLTERWASKFVTELFLNFTVVFIGYSIDDPVMRYITDAIAAEKRKGGLLFNTAYAIAEAPPSQKVKANNLWQSKGVVPILYSKGTQYHSNLHKSLTAWADYVKSGLSSKKAFLQREASIPPASAEDNTEPVRRVIDIIRERSNSQSSEITGVMADVFSKLTPPPPIEWLPVFEKHNLLEQNDLSDSLAVVSQSLLDQNLKKPNKVSWHLWVWLARHIETKELIEWVILRRGCLHPYFERLVKNELNESMSTEVKLFWRLITSGSVRCCLDDNYEIERFAPPSDDYLAFSSFVEHIQPYYMFKKSYSYFLENESQVDKVAYRVEVTIPLQEWEFGQIENNPNYPRGYILYMKPVVEALIKTMNLMKEAGLADNKSDRSDWYLKSIAKHKQNNRFTSWTFLIELSRDLWEVLYEDNPIEAKLMLDYWAKQPFPVFKRLIFYAMTVKEVFSPDESLEVLLDEEEFWLWSIDTKYEKFRLLNKIWPLLSEISADKLQEKIINGGPPRDLYVADISNEKYIEFVDRARWLHLSKLKSFGRDLNKAGTELLLKISANNPKLSLQAEDKDEFTGWHESWSGNKTDINVSELEAFMKGSFEDALGKLMEVNFDFHEGRIDSLRYLAKEQPELIVKFMVFLSGKDWRGELWHACLVGLAEADDRSWEKVAPLILDLSLDQINNESWAIAYWINSAAKLDKVLDDEEHFYFLLLEKVFAAQSLVVPKDFDDAVSTAINNPVGMLTESLISIISHQDLKTGHGLPDDESKNLLQAIINIEVEGLIFGRVILASRLYYFHAVDAEWAEKKLVPLFDYRNSPEAFCMWQGYLWGPRISADLARVMKEQLLISLNKYDEFKNDNQKSLMQVFVLICIEYHELYTKREIRKVLGSVGENGLKNAVSFLYQQTVQMKEEADTYWLNKVKPFILLWPKGHQFRSEDISIRFIELSAQLDKSFVGCAQLIEPLLMPVTDLHSILIAFKESLLPSNYPLEVFKLFNSVFNMPDNYSVNPEVFKVILTMLREADPNLAHNLRFREMFNYAQARIVEREV